MSSKQDPKKGTLQTPRINRHTNQPTNLVRFVRRQVNRSRSSYPLWHAVSKMPLLLRCLLYICILNFGWLVFCANHHFDTTSEQRMLRQHYVTIRPHDTVQIVIVSNRLQGIIPTVSSILTYTHSKPVDLVMIGDRVVNERVRRQFSQPSGNRTNVLHRFVSLTIQDVQDDLMQHGYAPIWTWDEWGSSKRAGWYNAHTIHRADWDNLETHAHELNHLRFYLPHLSIFQKHQYLYFLDDDILIQKDLGHAADATMANWDSNKAIITPCNIWMWSSKCHVFDFQSEETIHSILEMPSLYGDRGVCTSPSESHCVPKSYREFVNDMLPRSETNPQPETQKAWNFGFSLFSLKHWRKLKLTQKYERVMRESYRRHVFPETSLTFGLGVSYIAFAGAVACWKDESMRVRDGFGFIEYGRYERSLGDNFMEGMDVIHYTGPQKPWAANTTIDPRNLQPWLEMMAQETIPVPDQLETDPTNDLFTLLASDRTGANWVMTTLDTHPEICASGEEGKPETGFPTDALFPDTLSWFPPCSIKRSCSYSYVRDAILELHKTMDKRGRTAFTPLRCQSRHRNKGDPLGEHLPLVCNFLRTLNGNFTESNVARVWVDAFQREDKELVACTCQRGSRAKGLKVLAEWITYENFPNEKTGPPALVIDDTALSGSKIIRLKRRNLWARYKSQVLAEQTNIFHVTSLGEKQTQLASAGNITVAIDDMLFKMSLMKATDQEGDAWASSHGSDVLWLEYEECRDDTVACFRRIFDFLGVDQSFVDRESKRFESTFSSLHIDRSLEHVTNKGAVWEALNANGYGSFIESVGYYSPIQSLVYDAMEGIPRTHPHHQTKGINVTTFGPMQMKFKGAIQFLRGMAAETLAVLNVDTDSSTIFPVDGDFKRYAAIDGFRSAFSDIVQEYPGAVVVSGGENCCASSLTNSNPGDFFDSEGRRSKVACSSGHVDCQWRGKEKAKPWQQAMKNLAEERASKLSENLYLDASLVAGKASDLIRFIEATEVGIKEDERAVWTDYMVKFPERIVIDYSGALFGPRNYKPVNQDCPFRPSRASNATDISRVLSTEKSKASVLFRHSVAPLCSANETALNSKVAFPNWSVTGIQIEPVIDHLDRVVREEASIVLPLAYGTKPDYRQGPEIPYILDEKGVLTSQVIRLRTDENTRKWRMRPTESLFRTAYGMLTRSEGGGRWNAMKVALQNGGVPFWAWYGDYKSCNYHNFGDLSIPILTPSARIDCNHSFPIPNYMNIIDTQPSSDNWRGMFRETQSKYQWRTKIRKVLWRGALSEAEWHETLTSVRWRANKLIHELNSDLYDVGITSIPSWVSEKVSVNLSQVGGLKENIHPMADFQKYLVILDMDGNSWSSRFGTLMCYNSVVMKVDPKYVEYFWSDLKPWTHYIPVSANLSDLHNHVEWALDPKNDDAIRSMVSHANEWCSQRLVTEELAVDMLDVWESYVRFLNAGDQFWQETWRAKKEAIFSSNETFNFVPL